jgi:hypothetical protein
MSLDAIFIRFHRILSLRNTSPTADYIQNIVYKRRELLFGTQYDSSKVKGREKRLIKKVTVVKLLNKTSFYGVPPKMLTYSFSLTAQPTEITTIYKERYLSEENSLFKLASEIIFDSEIQRAYKVMELQIHFNDNDAKSRRYRLEVTERSSLKGIFNHIK